MTRTLIATVCALALAALGAGCHLSRENDDAPPVVKTSTAQPLGMFSTELPEDATDQALLALEQDAWRRELRFRDAVEPGWLFAATDVAQAEIEAGLWSPDETFQLGAQLFHHSFSHE